RGDSVPYTAPTSALVGGPHPVAPGHLVALDAALSPDRSASLLVWKARRLQWWYVQLDRTVGFLNYPTKVPLNSPLSNWAKPLSSSADGGALIALLPR